MERKIYKNNNGITLITLTITIVMMLIIMGIIISMEINKSGVVEITKSTKILQYKFSLEEKINEDILSYEIREKVEQSSNKMDTYKEYITKIIIKEIQNMELEKVLDYTNIVVKLNKKTSQNDNISIKIPLKTKVDDMTEIEINIKNTYKVYQNINAR